MMMTLMLVMITLMLMRMIDDGDTDADGMCPNVAEITVVNLDQ